MTPESIARLKNSFSEVTSRPRALAACFYQELFAVAPELRPIFPVDMGTLEGHFEAALALVIRNLEELDALRTPLGELGVQHVHWGAKPEHYAIVRDALTRAIKASSSTWNSDLEADWRRAITAICVPMLQGAAVHTAVIAEQLSEEL